MDNIIKIIIENEPTLIDSILFNVDEKIKQLREALNENMKVLESVKGSNLVPYYLSIRPIMKREIQKLYSIKSKIMGILDSSNMLCKLDLWNDTSMEKPLPLILRCRGPKGYCFTSGLLSVRVEKVEPYDYDVYWRSLGYTYKHKLISDRWLGYFTCGGHNRAYIRSDGALVISHDTVNFDGVHVIHFNGELHWNW